MNSFIFIQGLLIENQRPTFTCDARNPFIEDAEEEDHSLSDIVVDRLTFLTSQRNASKYIHVFLEIKFLGQLTGFWMQCWSLPAIPCHLPSNVLER